MKKDIEKWIDIKGYEGMYKVSNNGKIKGLNRIIVQHNGISRNIKGQLIRPILGKAYYQVQLNKKGKSKTFKIHQLVAIAFLDHTPCGSSIHVDHINNDKLDNRVKNLQLISHRENNSKDRKGSSKYTGVYFKKRNKKWIAQIGFNRKLKHIGCYDKEEDASKAYQNELNKQILKTT